MLEVHNEETKPPYDIYVGYLDKAEFTVEGKKHAFDGWIHKIKVASTNEVDDITLTRMDAARAAIKLGYDPDKILFSYTTVCAWVERTGVGVLKDKQGKKQTAVITTRNYESIGGLMASERQLEEKIEANII